MFTRTNSKVAALVAFAALACATSASADIVGGGTFTLNSGDPNAVTMVGGNWLVTTPIQCNADKAVVQMPILDGTGARWEYWWPEVDTNASAMSRGAYFSGGPLFAADLSTGQEWYQQNGVWRGPYASVQAIVTPNGHGLYAVDDWFEFSDASGRLISGWTDNGYRSSMAYAGPFAADYAYLEGSCQY
jgi:hypothetical protein